MGAMHRLVTVQFLKKTLVSLDDKAVDADEASSAVTTVEGMLAARPDFAQKHQWEYVMDSPLTVPLRLSLARMTKHYKGHQYLLEKGDRCACSPGQLAQLCNLCVFAGMAPSLSALMLSLSSRVSRCATA